MWKQEFASGGCGSTASATATPLSRMQQRWALLCSRICRCSVLGGEIGEEERYLEDGAQGRKRDRQQNRSPRRECFDT
eukprot:1975173-Rhodomonas_salina.5